MTIVNFKTKYTVFLVLLLCFSCVSVNKNGVDLYCNDFEVKFVNNDFGEILFFDDLKKAILSKLRILAKTSKQNLIDRKVCLMKIDVSKNSFMSIINNDGDIGRENIDIAVRYKLTSSEIVITGFIKTFYGNNRSAYPYSDYVKNKKNKQDEIDLLAEDIFMDIVRQIN